MPNVQPAVDPSNENLQDHCQIIRSYSSPVLTVINAARDPRLRRSALIKQASQEPVSTLQDVYNSVIDGLSNVTVGDDSDNLTESQQGYVNHHSNDTCRSGSPATVFLNSIPGPSTPEEELFIAFESEDEEYEPVIFDGNLNDLFGSDSEEDLDFISEQLGKL